MRHVEVARREGLDVVDVNVVDGERLPGRDVEGAADPVDLQGAVDLAALAQGSLFGVRISGAIFALLDAARVELPILLSKNRVKKSFQFFQSSCFF